MSDQGIHWCYECARHYNDETRGCDEGIPVDSPHRVNVCGSPGPNSGSPCTKHKGHVFPPGHPDSGQPSDHGDKFGSWKS